jgi:transcriptional regulator with XRE-family HTH domain
MRKKLITNPLKKRRVILGLTQEQVSSQLGITQSQYSRLEKSESDPTKYLIRLSKIFGCDPNELFGKTILRGFEEDFLSIDEQHGIGMIHHKKRPGKVFIDMYGWYDTKNIQDLLEGFVDQVQLSSEKGGNSVKPIIKPKPIKKDIPCEN